MFNKALFKQSCKANGTMWIVITLAVCFMLSCVMLISGNGNIGEVRNAIQDTIITKEIDSQMEKRSITYYDNSLDGLEEFDKLFSKKSFDVFSYMKWFANLPQESLFDSKEEYFVALTLWQEQEPEMVTNTGISFSEEVNNWLSSQPLKEDYQSVEEYMNAVEKWKNATPVTEVNAVTIIYTDTCEELQLYLETKATKLGYEIDSSEALELIGSVMYVLNPNGMFDEFYTGNGEIVPGEYDYLSLIANISETNYINSSIRKEYREERALSGTNVFLAGNMIKEENVNTLVEALSSYGVSHDKYVSFGYTYEGIKKMSNTALLTYQGRINYELNIIYDKYINGEFASENDYLEAVALTKTNLTQDISSSFLSTLPSAVSEALEEVGKADLYTLVVGSIFYKLAGLLLPIIYMIMASNNLIAGQVDSGSMAYVLSTSTKRKTVVFTQAVYLIGSLFAMFGLTTITSCICLCSITEEVNLTYGNLILLNLGAYLVLLALSGLCFFTSCLFNRSKRSMAIGGGLSIYALVAAMLGLFGSSVIPSIIRLKSLNYFNYTTVISLFDVISIMDGTNAFIWEFIVLGVMGICGYVAGSMIFVKKDLPL